MTGWLDLEAGVAELAATREAGYVLAVLVGAGLSYGAVPMAPEMITRLREQLDKQGNAHRLKGIDVWGDGAFSQAMDLAFPGPDAAKDRREFIDGLITHAAPQPAHHWLARLIAGEIVGLTLTTNFDKLIEIAIYLRSDRPTFVHIYGDTLPNSQWLPGADNHGKIRPHHVVKLHGDPLFEDLGNTIQELDGRTGPEMTEAVLNVLDGASLAILGYGCGDPNVMRLLHAAAARPDCLQGGLFFFGHKSDAVTDRVEELAAAMRRHGKPAHIIAPSSDGDHYDAESVLSMLATTAGADRRDHPPFGINEGHVGLVERIPRLTTTSVVHRPVSASATAQYEPDEDLIRRFVAPIHTLYLQPDTLQRKLTINRILDTSHRPLHISARLTRFYGPAEMHAVHQAFTTRHLGLQYRSIDLDPLKAAVGEDGTIVLDDVRIADLAPGGRYQKLHEALRVVAAATSSRILVALAGDTRHQPRGKLIFPADMRDDVCDRTAEGASAIGQRWTDYLDSQPPHRRDLFHALGFVRGAFRDDIWRALVDADEALLDDFTDSGLMSTSGPFRLVLLDDPPPGEPPAAAVRHIADRLVSVAKQRSPVDLRALFDAHDMYFRISAWPEAWQALFPIVSSLGIDDTSVYTHAYQQVLRWMDPRDDGLSPACSLPPREAAEFIHVAERVMRAPAKVFLERPEFATLGDKADAVYLGLLALPHASDRDFAAAVSYLKPLLPTHSKEALSVRAQELNRAVASVMRSETKPAVVIGKELMDGGYAGRLMDVGEQAKAEGYDVLAATSLDNAANLLRRWGTKADIAISVGLTRRVEALAARAGGFREERGGYLANRLISGLKADEPLGLAEARFVLSMQQYIQSQAPNYRMTAGIDRLGDHRDQISINRQLLDDEHQYIDLIYGEHGSAIAGYRPIPRLRPTKPR